MKKILLLFAIVCTSATHAQSIKKIQKLASIISPGDLQAKLKVIASAEMEGRETATPGQKKAASYIENYFRQLNLQPGTTYGYQMYFTVYRDSVLTSSLTVNGNILTLYKDYALSPLSLNTGNWTCDSIVFASFGITDSARNDFEKLNVNNKWVVVAEGSLEDADKPAKAVAYSSKDAASIQAKLTRARANGAKGLIVIAKDIAEKKSSSLKGNMYLKKRDVQTIPMLFISYDMAGELLGKSLQTFSDLKNVSKGIYKSEVSFSCTTTTNTLQSSNVIGILPGTDKKDEYVFITGHYDHLGRKDSVIWYGADDDGSGTTAVMELAEAFVNAKDKGYAPRRSLVFMTVSGEEKGLWGSDYYATHPIFPLKKVSVDLNIDMVGRIDTDRKYSDSENYVYTIGEDKLSSDLFRISDSVNDIYSHLDLDRKYNDPKDPNRFYYRSDHYNFAKRGVPVIFYFNGTHADYHQPTDTVDKINFDLMAKRVKLIFYTAWAMANRNDMLKRDITLK